MITTNINVTDGLTNGVMGTVTNVVMDKRTGKIGTILVSFDSKDVGQEARHKSLYKRTKPNAVPYIKHKQHFHRQKTSYQATRTQFPLTLAWAVTIHKWQGLTLPEIVIDMTPAKGKFKPGQAYVAFNRVRTIHKLHIINYTWNPCVRTCRSRDEKTWEKHLATNAIKYISDYSGKFKITAHKHWKSQNQNSRYQKWYHFPNCRHNSIEWNSFRTHWYTNPSDDWYKSR